MATTAHVCMCMWLAGRGVVCELASSFIGQLQEEEEKKSMWLDKTHKNKKKRPCGLFWVRRELILCITMQTK